jgi:hypothetical protein
MEKHSAAFIHTTLVSQNALLRSIVEVAAAE